jgi:mRNA-degrading endonuclease RelE of RelBE toxin-antitoxin system
MVSNKVQKDIDKLSAEATSLLKENLQKTQEIEDMIKGY